jgi:hypothetical protein
VFSAVISVRLLEVGTKSEMGSASIVLFNAGVVADVIPDDTITSVGTEVNWDRGESPFAQAIANATSKNAPIRMTNRIFLRNTMIQVPLLVVFQVVVFQAHVIKTKTERDLFPVSRIA